MKRCILAVMLIMIAAQPAQAQDKPTVLTVHEWGTFTTEHAADGRAKGYLNVIDPAEVLPEFVYRLDRDSLRVSNFGKISRAQMKAIDRGGHPDVIMRLETPVMYFYPGPSFDESSPVTVNVRFVGGLLNEYYPDAVAGYRNLNIDQDGYTNLAEDTEGSLTWTVTLSPDGSGPVTDAPVWLAPRAVEASYVHTKEGESERYLFYRGVAKLKSPLKTVYTKETGTLTVSNQADPAFFADKGLIIPQAWLVSVADDGTAAYKDLGPWELGAFMGELAAVKPDFSPDQHSAARLTQLKTAMHAALVADGLYPAEATAMLNTWEQAYFRNPGIRLFYIVPRPWTDHYLPVTFWTPVDLERVLIGRIDLDLN